MRLSALVVMALVMVPVVVEAQIQAGDRDPSFGGGDGYVTTDFGGRYDRASGMAIGDDGKIVAVGTGGSSNRFAVARYLPDGILDTSFSGDGKMIIPATSGSSSGLALLPDGKCLVSTGAYPNGDVMVARLNDDGSFDTAFGNDGMATAPINGFPRISALVIQSNGMILVGGYTYEGPGGWDWCLVRFNTDGTVDDGFGDGGIVITDFSRPEITNPIDNLGAVLVLPDGKILAGGSTSTTGAMSTSNRIYAMARYLPDGSLDPTYGDGGKFVFTFSDPGSWQTEGVSDLELLPDGRILAGGGGGMVDSALLRFNPDGSLDTTFGDEGIVVVEMVSANNSFSDIAVDSAGRIIAVGNGLFSTTGVWRATLARFDSEGTLDTTFGDAGKIIENFGTSLEMAAAVEITPGGRITMAGKSGYANAVGLWLLARYVSGMPVCDPGGPYSAAAGGDVTTLVLDGSNSYDPDGDPLTYRWASDCPGATFDDDTSPTPTLSIDTADICVLDCSAILTVDDGFESATASTPVHIVDGTPPVIDCPADIAVSSRLGGVEVSFDPTATDDCDADPEVTTDVPSGSVFEQGVTTVTITATDSAGNSSTCMFDVLVSCFGINVMTITKSDGQVGRVAVKGSFGPAIPIDLAADDVTFLVDDGQGFAFDVSIPAGSFRKAGGGPNAQRFVYASPRGSSPEVRAKFDLASCAFEIRAKNIPDVVGVPTASLSVELGVGPNAGREIVNPQNRRKTLSYRSHPKLNCCSQ